MHPLPLSPSRDKAIDIKNNISNKVKISYKIINETLKKVKEENICYTDTPVYENNYFKIHSLSVNNL